MKIQKKLLIIPLSTLILVGCTMSNNSRKKKSTASVSTSSSLTSIPEPDPSVEKTKLLYDYDDYHSHSAYGTDNCPLSGSPKLLIIPIWFSDSEDFISPSMKESVRSDIEKAYIGTNEETGWRSVRTFYQEESLNKLNLEATVADWYTVSSSSSIYGNDAYLSKTTSLVNTATTDYFNNHPTESRTDYDSNGDGYLDGVMLIYAAADSAANPSAGSNLWAYCYWLGNNPDVTNPTAKTFFWASYDFMYDSNNAYLRTQQSLYATGDCSHCNIDAHTFIHEMGHVLGLEDYYDNNESTRYCPSGGFSMQDWNIGGHDPYSAMAYGWAEPYIPTETSTILIRNFQATHDVILLANHSVDSPFDEYLLVELYSPTGLNKFDSDYSYSQYDRGPTDIGIRVWHVDARLMYATGIKHSWQGDEIIWSDDFISDPTYSGTDYGVYHVMANSYGGGYASFKGSSYYNFNLLQFIRNDKDEDYKPKNQMTNSDLFKQGDTFTMSYYANQFYKTGKMNNNQDLGWSFTVNSLSESQAIITVTKA